METPKALYSYFEAALRESVRRMGRGSIKKIALSVGVSYSFLSQVISPKIKKRASLELQPKIAAACGYDYVDFLNLGRFCLKPWTAPRQYTRYCEGFAQGAELTLRQAFVVVMGLEQIWPDRAYKSDDFEMGVMDGAGFMVSE